MLQESIYELVKISIDGVIYSVRVTEDVLDVIDVEPRCDLGDNHSRSSLESDNLRQDVALDSSSDDDSAIPETPPASMVVGKLKVRVVETLAGLEVLNELIARKVNEEPTDQPATFPGEPFSGLLMEKPNTPPH